MNLGNVASVMQMAYQYQNRTQKTSVNGNSFTSSDWRTRNDYPFEALFQEGEKSTEMIENWKPTGANPKNQRYLSIAPGSKAVMIHPKAQERMEKLQTFFPAVAVIPCVAISKRTIMKKMNTIGGLREWLVMPCSCSFGLKENRILI